MPLAKVCPQPGCPQLQPCSTHTPKPWTGSDRRQRLPKNWDTLRRRILKRDSYRCVQCGAPATDVDHIINNDDHQASNLQSLCADCHKKKTADEAASARRRS